MGFIQLGNIFINLSDISSIDIIEMADHTGKITFYMKHGETRCIKTSLKYHTLIESIRDAITYTDKADCTIVLSEREVL